MAPARPRRKGPRADRSEKERLLIPMPAGGALHVGICTGSPYFVGSCNLGVHQLMRLAGHGFEVECEWEGLLAPEVLALCEKTKTPHWMMLAGPHGEFELVFTVPSAGSAAVVEETSDWPTRPIRIGTVQERPSITLGLPSGRRVDIDVAPLRNLLETAGGDLARYLREFREIGSAWGLE